MNLILASNSPRRKEILNQIGLVFEVIPSDFEETAIEIEPQELVKHFAYMKASNVYNKLKNKECYLNEESFVIGADTIVFDNKILGKPKNAEHAYEMLRGLSNKEHYVFTGISVINISTGSYVTEFSKTKVFFKELSNEEIKRYIDLSESYDKAGGYGIQGLGSLFVKKIDGCYFNVVGFPIYTFSEIMKQFDVAIL